MPYLLSLALISRFKVRARHELRRSTWLCTFPLTPTTLYDYLHTFLFLLRASVDPVVDIDVLLSVAMLVRTKLLLPSARLSFSPRLGAQVEGATSTRGEQELPPDEIAPRICRRFPVDVVVLFSSHERIYSIAIGLLYIHLAIYLYTEDHFWCSPLRCAHTSSSPHTHGTTRSRRQVF